LSDAFSAAERACLPRAGRIGKSHGRTVTQLTWTAPASLAAIDIEEWLNCKMIAMVASLRQVKGKACDLEWRYCISSRALTPEEMARVVQDHWAIENKLHWMPDVNFGEDACTVKKDNAPEILSLSRRVVINLLSRDTTQPAFARKKLSKRQKRKFANLEESIMRSIPGIETI
jgi:predicted transposase YbfD/YdcC